MTGVVDLTDAEKVQEEMQATWAAKNPSKSSAGMEAASGKPQLVPQPPILTYAMILRPIGKGNEYCRIGIAEENYDWMSKGSKTTIVLV
jgi:hypothetical protein